MKPSRRNARRQSDESKRGARPDSQRPAATPVMDGPRPDTPPEKIDLGTEPFRKVFPDLARGMGESQGQQRTRRASSSNPGQRDKDKKG